jgi:hypothetical protein
VALRVEDVAEVAGGLRLRSPRSKTDQAEQGVTVLCSCDSPNAVAPGATGRDPCRGVGGPSARYIRRNAGS